MQNLQVRAMFTGPHGGLKPIRCNLIPGIGKNGLYFKADRALEVKTKQTRIIDRVIILSEEGIPLLTSSMPEKLLYAGWSLRLDNFTITISLDAGRMTLCGG